MFNPADIGIAFVSFFLIGMIPFTLVSLAVPYMVLRLRRDIPEHPQLGLKAGLQYFLSVSIMLALCGATVLSVDLLTRDDKAKAKNNAPNPFAPPVQKDDDLDEVQRLGFGILASGLLFTVLHSILGRNCAKGETGRLVERTFLGWSFAICGVVIVFGFTILMMLITQKNAFDEDKPMYRAIKGMFGVLLVWLPAWIVHLSLLYVQTILDRKPSRRRIENDEATEEG